MRSPEIDFVKRDNWLTILLVVFFVLITVLIGLWQWQEFKEEEQFLDTSIERLNRKLALPEKTVEPAEKMADPSWMKEAEKSLGNDWNRIFDRLEALNLSGIRLVSVQTSLHPPNVRAEFDLDSWQRIAELNKLLNPGGGEERWRLLSVSPIASNFGATGAVRAVWVE